MALTLGFLWLAARGGRRAARSWADAPAMARAAVAAAGAGLSVALVAALAAKFATVSFPGPDVTVEVDVASAAVWAGLLAAAATAMGAYLEGAPGRASAAVLRGGVAAYLWALGLLVVGFLVIATLEPMVTRRYVDGLGAFGSVGPAVFGAHILALPAQSALLLMPASGACVDLVASGATAVRICPWILDPGGSLAGAFLPPDPMALSPWFWTLLAIHRSRRSSAGVSRVRRWRPLAGRSAERSPGSSSRHWGCSGGVRRSERCRPVLRRPAPPGGRPVVASSRRARLPLGCPGRGDRGSPRAPRLRRA